MSLPNIPDFIDSNINKEQVINLSIASIALEKISLSHLVDAQAEEIRYAVGTLGGGKPLVPATPMELSAINRSADETLRRLIASQALMMLQLEDIIDYASFWITEDTAVVSAKYNGETLTDSNTAYQHTRGGGA